MRTRQRRRTAGRRRGWKYVVPLLAIAILGVAACSSGASSGGTSSGGSSKAAAGKVIPKSKIKIAIVAGGPNVYFTTWGQVAQVMSKQLGVTVTYVVPPTPTYDPSVEVSTIDSLVAQGYNAFAVFPDGESAIKPTYQRLISRGIPVFDLAGCTTDPTPALLCYATNVKASATYETQVLEQAMGGHGNIAFLTGLLTDANTALREQGVNQAIAASGGKVKLAQLVSNIDSPSSAPPAVESLLASKGSSLRNREADQGALPRGPAAAVRHGRDRAGPHRALPAGRRAGWRVPQAQRGPAGQHRGPVRARRPRPAAALPGQRGQAAAHPGPDAG